mmetsp:Transcript_28929/g.62045  ORF Transcript_28929/g.62045 Transcript_28929/m.62045 type:complete len:211 (-) Transcript_28929:174-806(-)
MHRSRHGFVAASDVGEHPDRAHLGVGFLGDHPDPVVQRGDDRFGGLQFSRRHVGRNKVRNRWRDRQAREPDGTEFFGLFRSHSLPLFGRQAPAVVEGVFLRVCFVVLVVLVVVIVVTSRNVGSLRGGDFRGFRSGGIFVTGKGGCRLRGRREAGPCEAQQRRRRRRRGGRRRRGIATETGGTIANRCHHRRVRSRSHDSFEVRREHPAGR